MKNILKFIKSFLFVLCFFGIFFLLFRQDYLNSLYHLPSWVIPLISCVFLIYFAYRFVMLYLLTDKIEYEFTSIVNHTFRTPLTRINWISKELEKDMSQDEKLLYIQNLNNATDKLLEIVDLIAGIKDIKNTTGYVFVATSMRDVVEKSIAKYREEINKKNITFQIPTFKDIPLLTADLKKITFAVDALLENAVTYTPKDGKILIDCILKSNNKLHFSIKDTGMGLSFYDKMRIFSRFYRSKKAVLAYPDGMGLRLYLAKQIILLHNGEIYAKSGGRNKGATFFIELPLSK